MERAKWQNPTNHSLCHHSIQSYGFNRFVKRIQDWSSSNGSLRCQECIKEDMHKLPLKLRKAIFSARFLWVCLDCDQIFCGGDTHGQHVGHIHRHAINNNHMLAIPIAAWCFDCKSLQWVMAKEENRELYSAIEVKKEWRGTMQRDYDNLPCGYVVRPLKNLGNACYFNAILQNLLSMDVLRENFRNLHHLPVRDRSLSQILHNLFNDTSDFLDDDMDLMSHEDLFSSICFRVPNFQGFQQQDSHELLSYLIRELLEERTHFIEDIFRGSFSSTVSCGQCGNTSKSYEYFFDLPLAIPSNECSTKKGKVITSEDLVHSAVEISSLWKQYISGGIPTGSLAPESLSSQLSTVCAADCRTKHHAFPREQLSAKIDKESPKEDLIKVSESLESQQKGLIVEEGPGDCCGQHPCTCNKHLGGVAEFVGSLQKDLSDKGGENPIAEVEDPMLEDLMSRYGGPSEVAKWPKVKQALSSEKEDLMEFQDVPKAENCPVEKSSGQNDYLDSDDKIPSGKLEVYSRKRHGCTSEPKFEGEKQRGNSNSDPLSIEKCLDLFTAPEILHGDYVCEHCSNRSGTSKNGKSMETELQSTSKNETSMEANRLGGHEAVLDEVKPKNESKDDGVDIKSRKINMAASKRYLLFKAPRILTIHLKRFTQGTSGIGTKINCHVNIPEILDLTPYMDSSPEDKEKPSRFRLLGVVEHLGDDSTHGHYVAYVRGARRQGNGLAWFRASDLDVRDVPSSEVLNSNAYLLFYERLEP